MDDLKPEDQSRSQAAHAPPQTRRGSQLVKTWLFRLVVVLVPTLIGLFAVVVVLAYQERLVRNPLTGEFRFQRPPLYVQEPNYETTGHKYLYDERLGWKNIPHWKWTSLGEKLTINSKGLRDQEHAHHKPPGTRRILVLGDSYAWGYGVSDEMLFSEILEQRLRGQQISWQVINSGVSGWGTDQELLFLEQEGFKYQPDIVVLAFFIANDPENNSKSRQYGLDKPLFVDTHLQLANVPVPKPGSAASVIKSEADAGDLTLAIIKRMATLCGEHGCDLIVAKFGEFLFEDTEPFRDLSDRLSKQLPKLPRVTYIDLDQVYLDLKVAPMEILVGNNDGHWNPYGHWLTADVLLKSLSDSGDIEAKDIRDVDSPGSRAARRR